MELAYNNELTLRIDPKEVPTLKDVPRSALAQTYVTPGGMGWFSVELTLLELVSPAYSRA